MSAPLRLCLVCQTRLPLDRFALDTGQLKRQCLDCSDVRKPAARAVERWKSRDQHKGAMERLMSLGYAASTARAWAHSPGRLTRAAARRVLLLERTRKKFGRIDTEDVTNRGAESSCRGTTKDTTMSKTTEIAISICLDTAADPQDYPWFLKLNGEQVGQVLDVESADATDQELVAALRAEFPTSYGTLAHDQITVVR